MTFRIILLLSILLGASLPAKAEETLSTVVVLADKSLTVPLTQLARRYSMEKHINITLAFATGREHANNIEEGAPADLFIAYEPELIEQLKTKGLVDIYSETSFLQNELVVVTNRRSPVKTIRFSPLPSLPYMLNWIGENSLFALGDAQYMPEGRYGIEALEKLNLLNDVKPYIVSFKDSYEMLSALARHGGLGISLKSDAAIMNGVRVISALPADSYAPIRYTGVVVAGENMQEARNFLKFLASDEAKPLFSNSGF